MLLFNKLIDSFSSLLFPEHCIHCHEPLTESLKLFCTTCISQIECIDPTTRCRLCFLEQCKCATQFTTFGSIGTRSYKRLGCCFEYEGPQKSLLIALKYQDKPYLAKSLSSFMFMQHTHLGWNIPDIITYIPQSFLRASLRGYNQSALLAEHLGVLMNVPVIPLLKRTSFTVSQTLLTKKERSELDVDTFTCIRTTSIPHAHILLIDDVLTTGQTVECAASALSEHDPSFIDVLCLMRTEI